MSTSIHRQPARLEDQLCFALYAASKAVSNAYRQRLREVGLTYPQYLAMLAIWEHGSSTVAEICAAIDLDSGTVSPLLQRLERAGLVHRERSASDERVVHVQATAAGLDLQDRVRPIRTAIEASTGLTDDEFAALRATLHRLRHTIAGEPAPSPTAATT